MGRTEPAGAWGWKLQPRGLLAPAGKLGARGGELGPRGVEEGRGEASVPMSPPSPQASVLHSVNRVTHPSYMLSSQQFLHRGHQPPPEMAGHSLASSHRNSST